MSEELFMEFHNELIEAYRAEHPSATEDEAIDATANQAMDKMKDFVRDVASATQYLERRALSGVPCRMGDRDLEEGKDYGNDSQGEG